MPFLTTEAKPKLVPLRSLQSKPVIIRHELPPMTQSWLFLRYENIRKTVSKLCPRNQHIDRTDLGAR